MLFFLFESAVKLVSNNIVTNIIYNRKNITIAVQSLAMLVILTMQFNL